MLRGAFPNLQRAKLLQFRRFSTSSHARITLLSKLYAPSTKLDTNQAHDGLRSVGFLLRAGYIRKSSAGIWSLLPPALMVMEKLEAIIEKEMRSIDASKISLPNLLSPVHWQVSGRWESTGPELWRLRDRKKSEMLLAPTHEEEITAMVASDVQSERQLPVRLFQIGRKFRDEARPRAALLRGREFVMKDLYTFDASPEASEATYIAVKDAYCRIFDTIGVPYIVATADPGNIGGSLSHEFHYAIDAGEDTLLSCPKCKTAANTELAHSLVSENPQYLDEDDCQAHLYDRGENKSLLAVICRRGEAPNMAKLHKMHGNAKPAILTNRALDDWDRLSVLLDESCATLDGDSARNVIEHALGGIPPEAVWAAPPSYDVRDVRTANPGELCPRCRTSLDGTRAIEVGHTFLLGTKYSKALGATFARTSTDQQTRDYFHMGCYGIGVTRLLGSVAEACADSKGLVWPKALAPFQACIIPLRADLASVIDDISGNNIVIDDRYDLSFGRRVKDADLFGHPYTVIIGKAWEQKQQVEIVCRQSGERKFAPLSELDRILKG